MSDTNTPGNTNAADNSDLDNPDLDKIEDDEDKREQAQLDDSLEEDGLLPVPEATPTDGQAPGA